MLYILRIELKLLFERDLKVETCFTFKISSVLLNEVLLVFTSVSTNHGISFDLAKLRFDSLP